MLECVLGAPNPKDGRSKNFTVNWTKQFLPTTILYFLKKGAQTNGKISKLNSNIHDQEILERVLDGPNLIEGKLENFTVQWSQPCVPAILYFLEKGAQTKRKISCHDSFDF